MTDVQTIWLIIGLAWTLAELMMVFLTRRQQVKHGEAELQSERLIWLVIGVSLFLALVLKNIQLWSLPLSADSRLRLGLILVSVGLALRIAAIFSLGQFFSTRVTIHHSHQLIRRGPYRYLRHPSYTGLICSFTGAGIAMGDLLSLVVLTVPLTFILIKRIGIEEPRLQKHFDKEYEKYAQHTKKLFPWLY